MARLALLVTLCALLALPLAACTPPAAPEPTVAAPPDTAPTEAATAAAPTETSAPAEGPATATPSPEAPSSPVPQSAPLEPDDCLVGTWEVSDMNALVTSMLPIDMQLGEGLKFEGVTGSLRYTFDPDFNVTLEADSYTFNFTLAVSEVPPMAIKVIMDGHSEGIATWAGESLTFAEGAPDNLKVTVIAAGQTLAGDAKVASLLPLGTAAQQTCSYQCAGDTLTILPPGPTALPIKLRRVPG